MLGTLKEDVQHTEPPARLAPARGGGQPRALGVEAIDLYPPQVGWHAPLRDHDRRGVSTLRRRQRFGMAGTGINPGKQAIPG
jgi:hypothetical protein